MNIIEIFSKVFEQKIAKNRLDSIQNSSGKANDNWKIKLPSNAEQRRATPSNAEQHRAMLKQRRATPSNADIWTGFRLFLFFG